ncbi:HAD family hydrolase [Diaminobutyricimonas sp. TR449]|uniref:HAD family hydrolase n=1 Tax=Diaminobutyricimonas sp. TR449 TaxID=2708076 RepID=UPI00141EE81F|nr:HAD family hydrolase [Diaminobutyricimonas sp. TR449]
MADLTDASTPRIQVVLFDLDDTLFAHRSSVIDGIAAHRRTLGSPFAEADDRLEAARWHALEEEHYHRYLAGELTYLEQRRARARAFVEHFGVVLEDSEADAWFDAFVVEYVRNWRLHDDALPSLDAMPGARFGVITNGDLAFQQRKLSAVGLSERLEHVIASGEVGYAKPDERIFNHACGLFGVPASQAAYIGDRLHTDALGAAAAGLTGVWIDRDGSASAVELETAREARVSVIRSLSELPALFGY